MSGGAGRTAKLRGTATVAAFSAYQAAKAWWLYSFAKNVLEYERLTLHHFSARFVQGKGNSDPPGFRPSGRGPQYRSADVVGTEGKDP